MYQLKNRISRVGACLSALVMLSTLTISVASAATYVFVNQLTIGSQGIEVRNLQNFLTSQGLYSGPITGYFGPLTKAAVERFQAKYDIETVGQVGPITRAQLNTLTGGLSASPELQSLTQQVANLQKQLDALTASSAASASILQGLQNQIANLQAEISAVTGSQGIGTQQGTSTLAQASGQTPQVQSIQNQIDAIQNIQTQLSSNPNPSMQDIQNQMNALQQVQNQELQSSGSQSPAAQNILNLQNQINSNSNPSMQDLQNQLNALQQIENQMGASGAQP